MKRNSRNIGVLKFNPLNERSSALTFSMCQSKSGPKKPQVTPGQRLSLLAYLLGTSRSISVPFVPVGSNS
jgi:hypothetical protein